jgi:cation transport ATPase
LLTVAAALEAASEHPLAAAILASQGRQIATSPVADFAAVAGKGVTGRLEGERLRSAMRH